jgi:thiol-disulfide isomerase/thioredoxin/uncharacterized membrane protein YphA (DoxX/SURF4 family)
MESLLIIVRLAIAGMFAVAGFSKLADQPQTRLGMVDFGLTRPAASLAAAVIPAAEISIAILLVLQSTAIYGAGAAVGLLALFSVAIGVNLLLGRHPSCNCFGQTRKESVTWHTLVRNTILLVAACAAFAGLAYPGDSQAQWATGNDTVRNCLLLACMLQAWFLYMLFQQNGRMLLRIDALESKVGSRSEAVREQEMPTLPVGSAAPAFRVQTARGETRTLDQLLGLRDRPTALVFVHPSCGPCRALMPELTSWQRNFGNRLQVFAITGSMSESAGYKYPDGIPILFQSANEVGEAYNIAGTPAAVIVNADSTIGAPTAFGQEKILELLGVEYAKEISSTNRIEHAGRTGQDDSGPALASA